jgi:hypothetical protein
MRWGSGNLYETLGFIDQGNCGPNYWYFYPNKMIRKHRFGFRKSILVKNGGDSKKTEWILMQEMGYDRIWDCGNKKFIWYNTL